VTTVDIDSVTPRRPKDVWHNKAAVLDTRAVAAMEVKVPEARVLEGHATDDSLIAILEKAELGEMILDLDSVEYRLSPRGRVCVSCPASE
jgi:hypothetical protein